MHFFTLTIIIWWYWNHSLCNLCLPWCFSLVFLVVFCSILTQWLPSSHRWIDRKKYPWVFHWKNSKYLTVNCITIYFDIVGHYMYVNVGSVFKIKVKWSIILRGYICQAQMFQLRAGPLFEARSWILVMYASMYMFLYFHTCTFYNVKKVVLCTHVHVYWGNRYDIAANKLKPFHKQSSLNHVIKYFVSKLFIRKQKHFMRQNTTSNNHYPDFVMLQWMMEFRF